MNAEPRKTWTVAEAKARLSEILRLASEEGPQRIGTKTPYVVVPEEEWLKRAEPRIPLGRGSWKTCREATTWNCRTATSLTGHRPSRDGNLTTAKTRNERSSRYQRHFGTGESCAKRESACLRLRDAVRLDTGHHGARTRIGIARLPRGRKRAVLKAKIANALVQYKDRILPVSRREAQEAAFMRAYARGQGRVLHLPDALIAATAKDMGLRLRRAMSAISIIWTLTSSIPGSRSP